MATVLYFVNPQLPDRAKGNSAKIGSEPVTVIGDESGKIGERGEPFGSRE